MMTIEEAKAYIRGEVEVRRLQGESKQQLNDLVAELFRIFKEVSKANGVFNRDAHYEALLEILDEVEQEV